MQWEDGCASTLAKDFLDYKENQKFHPADAFPQSGLLNSISHDQSMAKKICFKLVFL